jgi:hypothetical protein
MSTVWEGRWRVAGTNWEGRGWHLAPSLRQLAKQVSADQPAGQPGDGTVASQRHDQVSPNSDHRPSPHDEEDNATVRAIDIGETTDEVGRRIVDAIVDSRDPRVRYIIYEGRSIWAELHNGYLPWEWQPYRGLAPHTGHFHLSIRRTAKAENDTTEWRIDPMVRRTDKADDGNPDLAPNFNTMQQRGVFTEHTQPGGVTFNDEFGTFLLRHEAYLVAKYGLGTGAGGHEPTEEEIDAVVEEIIERLENG